MKRWNSVSCCIGSHSDFVCLKFCTLVLFDTLCLMILHALACSWLDLRSTRCSASVLRYAWAYEYVIIFWVISLYSKLKVQDGLPTESLWLMSYASIISDSDVEVETQVQEPEQGEASGDVWGVGLEDIWYMFGEYFRKWNTIFWKLLVYFRSTINDVYFNKFLEVLPWRLILECISDVM